MSAIHAHAARAPKDPLQPFEFEPGELAPDQVEIKVTHCGICHSDLSMLDNEWGMSQFPLVPGHEAVGTVAALGENAQGSRSDSGFAWDGRLQSCLSQFWHTGRSSHASMTGGAPPGTASLNPAYWEDQTNVVSIPGGWLQPSPHRALTVGEIRAIVGEYREAAARAKAAGFDGAEIHSGNGYLLDQFLQDRSNHRTDEYGGSIPNRARLLLEVTEAVASVWGGNRTAVRLSPSGTFNGMNDSDPQALFGYVAEQLNRFGLAYLHIIELRVKGNVVVAEGQGPVAAAQLRKIFKGRIIAAGGFEPDTAEAVVRAREADAVAFGRHFIANPDLPERIRRGYPLARHNRDTFYTFDAQGYTDYPTYSATTN
jgi:N-ethylmaleimide reductase